jgi:xylan 1,4-beta-xylosidase
VWNGTLDQGKMDGDSRLDRQVQVRVPAAAGASYTVRHYRIDAGHSNIVAAWERMRDGADWPDEGQWQALREMNSLDELCPAERAVAGDAGQLEFDFDLPMPGVSYLELAP